MSITKFADGSSADAVRHEIVDNIERLGTRRDECTFTLATGVGSRRNSMIDASFEARRRGEIDCVECRRSTRSAPERTRNSSMNGLLKGGIAGLVAWKWGGGIIGTILLFVLVFWLLGFLGGR